MIAIVKMALTAWFGQWLIGDAVVGDPIRDPVVDKLNELSAQGGWVTYWADYLLYGLSCPTCRGTWVTLLLRPKGMSVADVLAANALHVLLLRVLGDNSDPPIEDDMES